MIRLKHTGLVVFLTGLAVFISILFLSDYSINETTIQKSIARDVHREAVAKELDFVKGKVFNARPEFISVLKRAIDNANAGLSNDAMIYDYEKGVYIMNLTKYSSVGLLSEHLNLFFLFSIVLSAIGGLLYLLPDLKLHGPGIRNEKIFSTGLTSKGLLAIILGAFLTILYIILYWFPEYITEWILLVDPLSIALSGHPASQWFLYGLLYTIAILTMGVRMLIKYRHSKYQVIRTLSVVFFQIAFAFLIPEILIGLNQPYYDFKNMWPLKYDFFYDWNINQLTASGNLGIFMFVWGIILFAIGVPILTYFYGKRWYCSYVCGCGGLAETLGDPFRQLSDKSLKAWKVERIMVNGVLVFAVVMTITTLINYFSNYQLLGSATATFQKTYGFLIGSAFAGVIGTGFYPLMGNRVWCRFGCPLAAYLGLVQRFKSRFRITTNGGQCISCGNCSTYCEMGIDVRAYAQKGENIVRASCVGCGICAEVCPRGVLKLETGPEELRINN